MAIFVIQIFVAPKFCPLRNLKSIKAECYKKHFKEEKSIHKLLRALHKSQEYLIEKPLGRRPRENYIRSLHQKLTDSSEFRKFMMYLSLLGLG